MLKNKQAISCIGKNLGVIEFLSNFQVYFSAM